VAEGKVLDPNRFVISLGAIRFQGFADGDAITVEYDEDAFVESEIGLDGEFAWSLNANRRATVTVRLLQTSSTNIELDALLNGDMIAAQAGLGGAGITNFQASDLQGQMSLGSERARLVAPPNPNLAKTAQVREWKIRCAKLQGTHGGNLL
jgi:hypothetical protein